MTDRERLDEATALLEEGHSHMETEPGVSVECECGTTWRAHLCPNCYTDPPPPTAAASLAAAEATLSAVRHIVLNEWGMGNAALPMMLKLHNLLARPAGTEEEA